MVRTRSIWLVCAALGVLLSLLAVASASAFLPAGEAALPGPGHAWTWQNPLPHGNSLSSVAAVGGHVVVAGETEAVYHSADAGATWTAFGVDTNQTIPAVILDPATDGQQGWMVVSNDQGGSFQSECWATKDSGATWDHLSDFDENAPVDTLFQLDASTLYAGGDDGYLVVSDDGGATWDDISIPMDESYSAFVAGIAFVDADRGWAATARVVYGTEDGGKTWTRVKEFGPDPSDKFFPRAGGIAATAQGSDDDPTIHLYLTSALGGAWQSMDGGDTWDQCEIGGAKSAFAVRFLNPLYGIITGTSGKVWTTDDAGLEWVPVQLPLEFNVFSASWDPKSSAVYACGQGGMLARSGDAGLTWSRIGSGTPWTLFGATYKDPDTGWVVGEAGFIAATTDGQTWTQQRAARDGRADLDAVAFPTYRRGWAVGAKGTLLRTTDAGDTWQAVGVRTKADLGGVAFSDRSTGWIVGAVGDADDSRGVILATTDGGAHWRAQKVPAGVKVLNKVKFVDDKRGWAVGSPGVVLRTTDGGATWKKTQLAPKAMLLDVDFVDRKYGWVCGSIAFGGDIGYRTTDGGATWTREDIPEDAVQTVDFTDRKHGWQAGASGIVLYTRDGGASWHEMPQSAPSSQIFDIRMWSDGSGFVAGQFGTIMRTETGGQGVQ